MGHTSEQQNTYEMSTSNDVRHFGGIENVNTLQASTDWSVIFVVLWMARSTVKIYENSLIRKERYRIEVKQKKCKKVKVKKKVKHIQGKQKN